MPTIVDIVGKLILAWGGRSVLGLMRTGTQLTPSPELFSALLIMLAGFAICWPAEIWLTMKQLGYVRKNVLGMDSYDDAYKQVRHKFWAVILYGVIFYFLFFVWTFFWAFLFGMMTVLVKATAGMALVMLPIILVMVGLAIVTLLVMLLPLTLLFVVLACEDIGFFNVFGRAIQLTVKNFLPTLGFCSSICATWTLLYVALTMVLQVIYGIEYFKSGVYTGKTVATQVQLPLYIQAIGSCWNSIINMYLWPMFFLSCGFFYYSLRMRREGIDISHKLESLTQKRDLAA